VSESAPTPVRRDAETEVADTDLFPEWFSQFLNDRQTRKPSAHTWRPTGRTLSGSRRWSAAATQRSSP